MAVHFECRPPNLANVRCCAIRIAILLAGMQSAAAQDIVADAIPTGAREDASLIEAVPLIRRGMMAPPRPKYSIVLAPSYVATARASVYGAAIGFVSDSALRTWPFQLLGSAKRLDLGPALQTSLGAELKLTLFPNQKLGVFSTKAGYLRTLDVSNRQEYLLAAERKIIPGQNPLSLGASIAYVVVEPNLGSKTEGKKIASGVTWVPDAPTKLRVDYVFKTGIATEDDFTFTLQQPFPFLRYSPALVLVGGKHRVIAVSVVTTPYIRQ